MMKTLFKSAILTAAFLIPVFFTAGSDVRAAGEGQIEGGDIYRVKNLTDGGGFTDPVDADKCETLQYRVRIHDPGPGFLSQVTVKATLPGNAASTNVSTMTISAQNADPRTTSDTATVILSTPQKISYIDGTSELLDANGDFIRSISNVTAGATVNIGNVGVSVNERRFVQFKAKVDCPQVCVDNPQTPEDECHPCMDNPNTPADECHPCVDNPNTPNDECHPCVDNPQTPEDECHPCMDNPNTPGNECAPCVDNPQTPTNECKPPVPCKDNMNTPKDECHPVKVITKTKTINNLPDTGPGDVIAAAFGITMSSSMLYYIIPRRHNLVGYLVSKF